ncbi:MAG: PDZ domain-containing protein, partial [Muribaculaceae bacterium]|nr:PDZ domain-containing protein [Muribaculaceae bacterium]
IAFNMVGDTVYVISTVAGGPSERVGLLPGDRIISADDSLLVGRDRTAVMGFLRGDKGTKVNLKVRRGKEDIMFRVTRDDIPIYSVDAAYMADPKTGYIRISRFADDTASEVLEALGKLDKKGMVNLILDLQDNTGGYLGSAYELAELFLRKGDPVVSTRGSRVRDMNYNTQRDGLFTEGRIVVLVNQYSASASEILAGALQDNDRGIIVGRRTYGKGLVQRPFPMPDGSMIRLTTARYYTPSGRCIQKPYVRGRSDDYYLDIVNRYMSGELTNPDSIHAMPDSLRYTTLRNGRVVYGGGGIQPDVFVPMDTVYNSEYYRNLIAKGVVNQYVISYIDANRQDLKKKYRNEDKFLQKFDITDKMIEDLVARGEQD